MSKFPSGRQASHDKPIGWWGYDRVQPEPRSLVWLIRAGMLTAQAAAFLSLAFECRRSLIVAADPRLAGKTTLLTALLDFLPPETQPVYLRGLYERFTFRDNVPVEQAYLLCNEISAHLPTYLWGRGVRSVFQALAAGYPLASTMHAGSAADALDRLGRYPLEIPMHEAANLDLIVTLGMDYVDNQLIRRLMLIERIRSREGGIGAEVLAERLSLRAELQNFTGRMVRALGEWSKISDDEASRQLAARERLLRSWNQQGITSTDAVRQAIAADRRNTT